MLGTEGPTTNEELIERLPFPNRQVESILHELEVRNVISVGFYRERTRRSSSSASMSIESRAALRMWWSTAASNPRC